jgi:transcriptional regulator with GAF, ATPase, and Fis domain
MSYRLLGIRGPSKGTAISLSDSPVQLGRDSNNQVKIEDLLVSRQHCLLHPEVESWAVEDLGSANGTFVNSDRVNRRLLQSGDQLQVGEAVFLFLKSEAEGPDCVTIDEDAPAPHATVRVQRGKSAPVTTEQSLQLLTEIGTSLNSWNNFNALQRQLLASILRVLPAERAAVITFDPGSDTPAASYGWDRRAGAGSATHVRVSRTIIRTVLDEACAIAATPDDQPHLLNAASLRIDRITSLVAAPLMIGGHPIGLIYLDTTDPARHFTANEVTLLSAIAGMASQPLDSARRIENLDAELRILRSDLGRGLNIVGDSPNMQKVYDFILRAAPSDSTVLILGESGTGKELAARAIHSHSPRSQGPWIAVNCAAIAENLLESELFGHERGAFTGAVSQKRGKVELAAGGTLFLDEIGELPLSSQAKLLRAIQEREFERVGGSKPIKVDFRLVAATNQDLSQLVAQGKFRADLFYRINVVALKMPALRHRGQDILLLAELFLQNFARKAGRPLRGFTPATRAALLSHNWPGNVRELQNSVERAVVLGQSEWIEPCDLPEEIAGDSQSGSATADGYHAAVLEAKRRLLREAMESSAQNHTQAAARLGINVKYLHRLLRVYGLKPSP